MNNLTIEELQQFSYRLAIPSLITLVVNLFGLTTLGLIISVAIHIIVLGIFFVLFKEYKSAFLKFILAGLILCLAGEVVIFFNLDHVSYGTVYWAFLAIHCARNIVLGLAYGWNVLKSQIYNPFWIKAVPVIVIIPIFFILQFVVFSQETSYKIVFILYNLTLCFMLVTAGLRYDHSSQRSFIIMILAALAFILSEVAYFWLFVTDGSDPSTFTAFRAPLLQLGSCLLVSGTVDHVLHHKLTQKNKIYIKMTDRDDNTLRGKIGPLTKNINNIPVGKTKFKEPLI